MRSYYQKELCNINTHVLWINKQSLNGHSQLFSDQLSHWLVPSLFQPFVPTAATTSFCSTRKASVRGTCTLSSWKWPTRRSERRHYFTLPDCFFLDISKFPGCQKTPGAFGGGHDTDVEERHKETLNSLWLEPQKTRDDWKTVSAEFAFCGVTRETLFFERTTFFKWSSMGFFKRWCPWLGSESDSLCPLTWSNVIQARGGCTCTSFTLCTCNYLLVLDIVFLAVRAPDENYVTTYYID